jgi:diacylglycerol kinase family enzyme
MRRKRVCLIINPHAGKNFERLSGILTVFAAAGWKTELALKEYGGHAMELAKDAAERGYDLIVAYGGDGTLNQVVNGVMNARAKHGRRSVIGVVPGGTANQWATELGIPADPVKAALLLVNSRVRSIDIGHLDVLALDYASAPDITEQGENAEGAREDGQGEQHGQQDQQDQLEISAAQYGTTPQHKKLRTQSGAKHHFLLTAGLGIDAAVIGGVSKTLKYRVGRLAFGVAAAKKQPSERAFPLRIAMKDRGGKQDKTDRDGGHEEHEERSNNGRPAWEGQSVQVLLGNTRRYADVVELTPNAYINDGVLDMCVITSGSPLATAQQIMSLLVRRKPADSTTEYFHGAHLTLTLPAAVSIQLDGSAVPLKRLLRKSDLRALQGLDDPEQALLTYRFDALPRALRVVIPRDYDGLLFEPESGRGPSHTAPEQTDEQRESQPQRESGSDNRENDTDQASQKHQTHEIQVTQVIQETQSRQDVPLSGNGRVVSVISAVQVPGKQRCAIIAGMTPSKGTGALKVVAVKLTGKSAIQKADGQKGSVGLIKELQEGQQIVVEGRKSKRGVITARRVII